MQVFILLLKIVNFLLKQLDIKASQLQGRRVLNVVSVDVEQIRLHLNRNGDYKTLMMSKTCKCIGGFCLDI